MHLILLGREKKRCSFRHGRKVEKAAREERWWWWWGGVAAAAHLTDGGVPRTGPEAGALGLGGGGNDDGSASNLWPKSAEIARVRGQLSDRAEGGPEGDEAGKGASRPGQ